MEASRFDDVTRSLTCAPSRRGVWRGFVAVALGLPALRWPGAIHAKGKNKKKIKRNEFGCVNVGGKCRGKDANCCSGICQGKKPKKGKKDKSRCVAHDESTCQQGQNACGGDIVNCSLDGGDVANGLCFTTTGNAQFCGKAGFAVSCTSCQKDSECIARCGAGAACVKCEGETCVDQAAVCVGHDFDCAG